MSLTTSGNEAKTGQSSVLCPSNNNYWVASRCVATYETICGFEVRLVRDGVFASRNLFYTDRSVDSSLKSVFPLITLDFNKLSGNSTDGWSVN